MVPPLYPPLSDKIIPSNLPNCAEVIKINLSITAIHYLYYFLYAPERDYDYTSAIFMML
jgi:hypothetical protein